MFRCCRTPSAPRVMVLYTAQHYELRATQEKMLLQRVIYSTFVPVNDTKYYKGVKIHLHSFLAEQETARTAEKVCTWEKRKKLAPSSILREAKIAYYARNMFEAGRFFFS